MKKILDVPYFIQPTSSTCQSVCVQMVATYLLQKNSKKRRNIARLDANSIKNEINKSPNRPNKKYHNHNENMRWWLKKETTISFDLLWTSNRTVAHNKLTNCIRNGFPVIALVHHGNLPADGGHVIVIVGYDDHTIPNSSPATPITYFCHDPYGHFYPTGRKNSNLHGSKRWNGGFSWVDEGGHGPGAFVKYSNAGIYLKRNSAYAFILPMISWVN